MKYPVAMLSAFTLLLVSSYALAERVKHGDWTVDHAEAFNEAYTENAAGQSIGFWCSTEEDNCFFYLRTNTDCKESSRAVIKASTEIGTSSFELLCHQVAHDGDYHSLYFFTDTAQTKIMLEERHYIEFSLSEVDRMRFSLKGSKLSISRVSKLSK